MSELSSAHRVLKRAPIVEAVVEILVDLPSDVDMERLELVADQMKGRYPTKQVRSKWAGQINVRGGQASLQQGASGPMGFALTSADGKQVVQIRQDGFAFSRLRPYQDWHSFVSEAKNLWSSYMREVRPERMRRVGLRYINQLDLPLPVPELRDYILTLPEIAATLPQGLSGFFFRLAIPDDETGAEVIISETIGDAPASPATLPLILDIDVIKQTGLPRSFDAIWPLLERFRELKNRFFFESLTDQAKELFDK